MKGPNARTRRIAFVAGVLLVVPAVAVATSAGPKDHTRDAREAIVGGKARSVILLIGDGMGDSEITIARNYHVGAAGRLALDKLPMTGAMTTYSIYKDTLLPDYDSESASTGSAWATGRKTYDGAISVLPNEKPVPTMLELAKKAGYRTGDVTTAEVQDATPAVQVSHVVNRNCKGPVETTAQCPVNAKENGGAGSISEQMVDLKPDVILGGGRVYFDQTVTAGPFAGQTVWQQARAKGFQLVTTAAGLAAANGNRPILGAFAPTNMDLEWVGPTPTPSNTPAATCSVNPARSATQPHLAEMTKKAIDVLDRKSRGQRKGFFLQVEGASIDKQDHAANPCGQIGETVAFDAAVQEALRYQRSHPDTLIIVTADHAHTSQIVEAGSVTEGVTATLLTKDGSPMSISYATAPITGSQQHTGSQVRVGAMGPQAANVLGVIDQTEIFYIIRRALGA